MNGMIEFITLTNDEEPEPEYPKYSDEGRILVRYYGPNAGTVYRHEIDVLDYDGDSSLMWVNEGMGFDYFLDEYIDFEEPGVYVIEEISGMYFRGDWSYGEDDDEEWYIGPIRKAADEEIKTEALGD